MLQNVTQAWDVAYHVVVAAAAHLAIAENIVHLVVQIERYSKNAHQILCW